MKKFIYSALVAIVAVGAIQTAKATIILSDSTVLPCSDNQQFDCAERTSTSPNAAVSPASGGGTVADYGYDLAD